VVGLHNPSASFTSCSLPLASPGGNWSGLRGCWRLLNTHCSCGQSGPHPPLVMLCSLSHWRKPELSDQSGPHTPGAWPLPPPSVWGAVPLGLILSFHWACHEVPSTSHLFNFVAVAEVPCHAQNVLSLDTILCIWSVEG